MKTHRYILVHKVTGLYFVIARGFSGNFSEASRLSPDQYAAVQFCFGDCFALHLASTLG
jgi:hypothetical protein